MSDNIYTHRKPALQLYLKPGHKIGKPAPLFIKIEQSRLDELKKRYGGATQDNATNSNVSAQSIDEAEKAVTAQGDKVRSLKAAKADKSIVQEQVKILLDLKKVVENLKNKATAAAEAITKKTPTHSSGANVSSQTIEDAEKAVATQGDKVRKLKAAKADKPIIQEQVKILLDLKKKVEDLRKSSA